MRRRETQANQVDGARGRLRMTAEVREPGADTPPPMPQWEFRCPAFTTTLFVSDLDPFELLKDAWAHERFRRTTDAPSEFLRLSFGEIDLRRIYLANFNRIFHTYLMLKGILASVLQFLLLQHELYTAKSKRTPPLGLVDRRSLEAAKGLVGNPMAALGGVSIYLYTGMTGLAFMRIVVIPWYHRHRRALDMAYVRFLLLPRLEQRRLDAMIEQKLNDLEQSMVNFAENRILKFKSHEQRQQPSGGGGGGLRRLASLAVGGGGGGCRRASQETLATVGRQLRDKCAEVQGQVRSLASGGGECPSLRPAVFQLEWHGRICSVARRLFYTLLGSFIAMIFILVSLAVQAIVKAHSQCASAQQVVGGDATIASPIQPLPPPPSANRSTGIVRSQIPTGHLKELIRDDKCHLFTWCDGLLAFELLFCILCCACFESNYLTLYSVNISNQIKLITTMRHELDECERSMMAHATISKPNDTNQLNRLLLKQVAKLAVFEAELADGFRVLSQDILMFMYHCIVLAILMLLTDGMQTALSQKIHNATFALMFIWLNTVALLCCAIHALLTGLDKRYWSILAQITTIQTGQQLQSRASTCHLCERLKPCVSSLDVVKDLWLRFVMAASCNIDHYCVRPFGFPLTYRRVIELNFMSIFIYSLTLNKV